MNIKRTKVIALVIVGTLALAALLLTASGTWAGPSERILAGPLAPAGVVSSTLSYQGRLLDVGGEPLDGTREMTFRLYDVPTDGTALWTQVQNVEMEEGLFNAHLDVDAALFNGQALWLGVQVAGDAQELSPRQPLLPAPYALALPGLWTQQNATSPNLIGGYGGNSIGPGVVGAVIGGGGDSTYPNQVTADYGTIGGGDGNLVSAIDGTVGGGFENTAGGDEATVGGGAANVASGYAATVGGGGGFYGVTPLPNIADGDWSTVGGGAYNTASGDDATVSGGYDNEASGDGATVGGGDSNEASGGHASLGGGESNTVGGWNATVGGGFSNTASGNSATVGGGDFNASSGGWSTIGGGVGNKANGSTATVGGGDHNTASGKATTVGGGHMNHAAALTATIGGGEFISVTGQAATVGGGWSNTTDGEYATISGGAVNRASGHSATVGGGKGNAANGDSVTISGGAMNTATYYGATISGGYNNIANFDATVGGGASNTASGDLATIGGGGGNDALGDYATIPGGGGNHASGNYSFAAGEVASATHDGSFVWSSSGESTSSWGNNTFTARAHGGVRFYSASGTTNGVELASSGNGWGTISDRNVKENFADVDVGQVLETLAAMPIQTWNLKAQSPDMRHVGPVAQDFNGEFAYLFSEVESPTHINNMDAIGIAMVAVQGLYAQNQELAAENAALQAEVDDLGARVAALETTVEMPQTSGFQVSRGWLLLGGLAVVAAVVGRRRLGGGR